jgi:hypothetical protein
MISKWFIQLICVNSADTDSFPSVGIDIHNNSFYSYRGWSNADEKSECCMGFGEADSTKTLPVL